jgi:hypothetical protein
MVLNLIFLDLQEKMKNIERKIEGLNHKNVLLENFKHIINRFLWLAFACC